jgi:hypothetical protein
MLNRLKKAPLRKISAVVAGEAKAVAAEAGKDGDVGLICPTITTTVATIVTTLTTVQAL